MPITLEPLPGKCILRLCLCHPPGGLPSFPLITVATHSELLYISTKPWIRCLVSFAKFIIDSNNLWIILDLLFSQSSPQIKTVHFLISDFYPFCYLLPHCISRDLLHGVGQKQWLWMILLCLQGGQQFTVDTMSPVSYFDILVWLKKILCYL